MVLEHLQRLVGHEIPLTFQGSPTTKGRVKFGSVEVRGHVIYVDVLDWFLKYEYDSGMFGAAIEYEIRDSLSQGILWRMFNMHYLSTNHYLHVTFEKRKVIIYRHGRK